MRNLALLSLLLLLLSPSAPAADAKRWLDSAACAEQCEQIQSCAAKVNRAEQGRVLCHIAACESGKFCAKTAANKPVRSPNGLYHGPFQFSRGTWRSICQPIFAKNKLAECRKKNSIYNSCCNSMCAAEIIGAEVNRGIQNWPRCGPAAQRAVAAEKGSP